MKNIFTMLLIAHPSLGFPANLSAQELTPKAEETVTILTGETWDSKAILRSQKRILSLLKAVYLDTSPPRPLVGGIALRTLIQNLTGVTFARGDRNTYLQMGSCQTRRGMVNFQKQKKVTLSPYFGPFTIKTPFFDAWVFHESLEALGYFDENYGLSIGLLWVAQLPDHDRQQFLKSDFFEVIADKSQETFCDVSYKPKAPTSLKRSVAGDGGSTGVGSGGDPWAIELKYRMLDFVYGSQTRPTASSGSEVPLLQKLIKILKIPMIINYSLIDSIEDMSANKNDLRALAIARNVFAQKMKAWEKTGGIQVVAKEADHNSAIEVTYYPFSIPQPKEFIRKLSDRTLNFDPSELFRTSED